MLKIQSDESDPAPMIAGKAGHAALDAHFKDDDWRSALHESWGEHIFRGKYDWLTMDFLEGVVEQYIEANYPLGLSHADAGKVV